MAGDLTFAKYHGLGNDFLIVDLRGGDPAGLMDPNTVRRLCDRQFGVGADGVLAVLPPTTSAAAARMRVLNADGSEAQMCGNGLRCVVSYLQDRKAPPETVVIETGAGLLACQLTRRAGAPDEVTVNMGRPRLRRGDMPMVPAPAGEADDSWIETPIPLNGGLGGDWKWTAVSMSNPHIVTFIADDSNLMELARVWGPRFETHPWFPERTNVEFARVLPNQEIELVVWERGCGITLACGTGACATAVAARLSGRVQADREITVNLPGGALAIRVDSQADAVFMRGSAVHVFDGALSEAGLRSSRPTARA